MSSDLTAEDLELDARWRMQFGVPLPILGAHALVRSILDATPADASGSVDGPRDGANVIYLADRRPVA